jgi:hypothetical protein
MTFKGHCGYPEDGKQQKSKANQKQDIDHQFLKKYFLFAGF